jgi:phospholipid/cholesterol/gamma-HCH transport system ATP-binding protein
VSGSPAIALHGIVNRFGPQVLHDGLDLEVQRGEVMGLIGGSGSGKSVLLRTIVGLRHPQAGSIELMGKAVDRIPERELDAVRSRYGLLFQDGALFSSMTVARNIQLPLRER